LFIESSFRYVEGRRPHVIAQPNAALLAALNTL
jgi:hypothetical protein